MELNEKDLKKYKQILLDSLTAFDKFCLEHRLNYYGAYGTVIGAVRHHGFIPWDDDIDVVMPREDYEKMLKLKREINPNYYIFDKTDLGYYKEYAKLVDIRTSLWEEETIPFMIGAFIDIFPMDTCSSNFGEAKKIRKDYVVSYWNIHRSETNTTWKEILKESFNPFDIRKLCIMLYSKVWLKHRHNKIIKKFDTLDKMVKGNNNGDNYVSYWGIYKDKEIMPKSWFSSYVEMPFDNSKVRIPIEYDKYLRQLYGDYMKLPPVEEQMSHHTHYYFNLEERVSIEEAKKIIDKKIKRNESTSNKCYSPNL